VSRVRVGMTDRRTVLKGGAAALGVLGLGALGCRGGSVPPPPRSQLVELADLIATAPRDQVLEQLAPRLAGVTPATLLAALRAAATRHVVPRSSLDKTHHALLCLASVHVLADHLSQADRWQPALWAVDYFKWAQSALEEPDRAPLPALADGAPLPPAAAAARAFEDAIESFDGGRAELALAALLRAGRRDVAIELLLKFGSRDLRHIGHKAIYVANALATLDAFGAHGEEEVLRSVALALGLHYTDPPRDLDGTWAQSRAAGATLGPDWQRATAPEREDAVVSELLAVLRSATPGAAVAAAADALRRGAGARAIWDAQLASSAELLFNHPTGVEALHAVTASNAAHAAFRRTRDDATRRLLVLQNAARVADFHAYAAHWAVKRKRPAMFTLRIEELEPLAADVAEPVAAIFASIGGDPPARLRAAQQTLAYVAADPAHASRLAGHAASTVVARAVDTHDLKLLVAAIQDHAHLSPRWRNRYLAACTARFVGTSAPVTEVGRRVAGVARTIA
jgi:hypothetical protein